MIHKTRINRRLLLGAGIGLPLGLLAHRSTVAASCDLTPAQTRGPFFPVSRQSDEDVDLTRVAGHDTPARGQVLRVHGQVLDTSCMPVAGVLVDLWQADSFGRYRHPADPNPARPDANFQGWGQAVSDSAGRYSFKTIKPAAYPLDFLPDGAADARAGYRTPHIHFRASKRGYVELATQMYFAGETLNDTDFILQRVPARDRPKVVIAAAATADGLPVFRFDITIVRA
jgi:protocatechuate 3,4-dioxygenase beta subunit